MSHAITNFARSSVSISSKKVHHVRISCFDSMSIHRFPYMLSYTLKLCQITFSPNLTNLGIGSGSVRHPIDLSNLLSFIQLFYFLCLACSVRSMYEQYSAYIYIMGSPQHVLCSTRIQTRLKHMLGKRVTIFLEKY